MIFKEIISIINYWCTGGFCGGDLSGVRCTSLMLLGISIFQGHVEENRMAKKERN